MSTLFTSSGFRSLATRLSFLRESQQVISRNISRVHVPGALPEKMESTVFPLSIDLVQPEGLGFQKVNHNIRSNTAVDTENLAENLPGRSRISLSKELRKMSDVDDEHNMGTKLMMSWKKAYNIAMGRQT